MQAPADWWYIDPDSGAVTGPVTGVVMIDLAHQGVIRADTMVSRDAGMTWRSAGTVRGFPVARDAEDDSIPDVAERDRLSIGTGRRPNPGMPWHNIVLSLLAYSCIIFGVVQFSLVAIEGWKGYAVFRSTYDGLARDHQAAVDARDKAMALADDRRGPLEAVERRREALRAAVERAEEALAMEVVKMVAATLVFLLLAIFSFSLMLGFSVVGMVVLAALDVARDLRIVRARLD
jgi:hypothetical protein